MGSRRPSRPGDIARIPARDRAIEDQPGATGREEDSASWLNLVERFLGELTTRQLRRLAVPSVRELETAIDTYIAHRNAADPFTWTASVRRILAKVKRLKTLRPQYTSSDSCDSGPMSGSSGLRPQGDHRATQ